MNTLGLIVKLISQIKTGQYPVPTQFKSHYKTTEDVKLFDHRVCSQIIAVGSDKKKEDITTQGEWKDGELVTIHHNSV